MYIYGLPVTPCWNDIDSELLPFVSLQRQEKIIHYVYESDRKLSLFAALLARFGLSLASFIPPSELVFDIKTNKKPLLLSAANLHFNLSHTHHFVLCGITDRGPIGVDTERIQPAPFEVMDLAFHPDEIRYVKDASALARDIRFYNIWTRKEAYVKQLGTGLGNNLPSFNTLSGSLSPSLRTWQHGDYICSVCSKSIQTMITRYPTESELHTYFLFR